MYNKAFLTLYLTLQQRPRCQKASMIHDASISLDRSEWVGAKCMKCSYISQIIFFFLQGVTAAVNIILISEDLIKVIKPCKKSLNKLYRGLESQRCLLEIVSIIQDLPSSVKIHRTGSWC